nr:hypothetical protein [Kandeliimicrobium roseum]
MISRLMGAALRGFFTLLLILTPALLLPGVSADSAQVVMLIGLFAAALTFVEYSSAYPCLFEFRDAPPFNRTRFVSLFVTVFLLSVMARGVTDDSTLGTLVTTVGRMIADAIDFPYSPVRLSVLMLPADAPAAQLELLHAAAGLAYLISLLSLAVFYLVVQLKRWPLQNGSFNVWINLPTFDPTTGGDVVSRLRRDSRINVVLGFLLPFLMPAAVSSATTLFDSVSLMSPQTMIWTVAAWAFLPASLMMRGMAMSRLATMIAQKRKQVTMTDAGLLPA